MRVDIITFNHNHPILSGGAVSVIRPENSATIMRMTMATRTVTTTMTMACFMKLDSFASFQELWRRSCEVKPDMLASMFICKRGSQKFCVLSGINCSVTSEWCDGIDSCLMKMI